MVSKFSFAFTCGGDEFGKAIEMLLSYSEVEQLITLSCTFNYHKYLFKEESATIMHFKYYKTCLMNSKIACAVGNDYSNIKVTVGEVNSDQFAEFTLSKQERDYGEKLDIMFETMMKEIAELKEKLWYADKSLNKMDEKYISNWNQLQQQRGFYTGPGLSKTIENSRLNLTGTTLSQLDLTGVNTSGIGGSHRYFYFDEKNVEPLVIYFKHSVEFYRVECCATSSTEYEDINIYVYGVEKPKGEVRKDSSNEKYILMPKFDLLVTHATKQNVPVIIQIPKPGEYDGIGLAVRSKLLNSNQCPNTIGFTNLKIF